MRGRITVIGEVPVAATLPAGARGADVVVLGRVDDAVAAARLAPAAVLLLVDGRADDVARVLAATLWPPARVVGVRPGDAESAARAIAGGDHVDLRVTMRDGDRDAVLGRGGVVRLR